jgi:hypothetical protein
MTLWIRPVALLLGSLASGMSWATGTPDSLRVITDTGTMRGAAGNGVREFKGIPFALPPVPRPRDRSGSLRGAALFLSAHLLQPPH